MPVLFLTIFVAVLDQASKLWVASVFSLGEGRVVIAGFFDLRHVQNMGAAWGILSDWTMALAAFSLLMLGVFIKYRHSIVDGSAVNRLAMGLMLGGIIGNLIDRVKLGYVIDFLDFYWGKSHFPAFNVADAGICCGVFVYALNQFLRDHRSAKQAKQAHVSAGQKIS